MTRILIRDGHLVPGADLDELPGTDLLIEDGVIVGLGPAGGPSAGSETEVDEIIDASGLAVLPGFVDSHRHVWQAPLRGIGADLTLPDYFEVVLGRALSTYRPEDARLAALLGAVEALDAGITTVFDWCNTTLTPAHTDAVVDGLRSAGIRAVVAATSDGPDADRLSELDGRVTGALAVLGPEYGPWEEWTRQIARARELGVVISMHAGGGRGVIERMAGAGLLGPDVNLVHLNQVTELEARLLADTGTGTTVTPVVEGTMGHGASAYTRLRAAGGRPGLGTDVVVNAPPDLFEPMRDTLRGHRLATGQLLPAARLLPTATVDSARAVGLDGQVGTLTVGKRADVILVDGVSHLADAAGAVAGGVVTTLGPANVRTVLVDGQVVKRDGRLVHSGLDKLRAAADELARRALSTGRPVRA